jgi:hypothetical protein
MYYRFEAWLEGEPSGVGFMQGLQDIGIGEEEENRLLARFNEELPYPPDDILEMTCTKSWFTEAGYEYFRPEIDAICTTYWETDMWEAIRLEAETLDNIIYEDEYQVVQECDF